MTTRSFIIKFIAATLLFGTIVASAASKESIVIALKPNKNPDKMASERKKLESELSSLLGKKVEVIVPLSSSVILQGFANGTIDLGYLSSVDMVNAMDKKAAGVLLAGRIKNKTSYESIWLVRKNSSVKDFPALKGKSVAFASRTSTSGYLIPYWDLIHSGLINTGEKPEKYFGEGNVSFGTGYVSAVQKVLNGQAEAAAVSDYVFFGNKHLSPKQKGQLRVLKRQGPVPTHSIAFRSSLNPEVKSSLKKALLKLGQSNPDLRNQVFTSELVEVNAENHLATTKDALKKTGLVLRK